MFSLKLVFYLFFPIFILYYIIKSYIKRRERHYRNENSLSEDITIIAFFHPFCNSGGGGERVLWVALRALHRKYPNCHYVVYTGDVESKPQQMVSKAKNNFKIDLNFSINFVYLKTRPFVSAHYYPFFTLLCQSIGSLVLGFEAIHKCVPNVFIDSMGYSFTFPIFKYLGHSLIGAYVHYPTISTDMLEMVSNRVTTYNNRAFINNIPLLSKAKLLYYKLFAYLYGVIGRTADVVMVNSSWTQQHIEKLWKRRTRVVYPPCNTNDLSELSLENKKDLQIVSIGQIRPEKNHRLQLMAFQQFLNKLSLEDIDTTSAKLIIIGSCRDTEDQNRVNELNKLCDKLQIRDSVEFKINISYEELKSCIQESSIGLHTMINEHFGISVVECLAAGLVTLAHESGGPKMDIIVNEVNGFLASDPESFAEILYKIVKLDKNVLNNIRVRARQSVDRFSEQVFENSFLDSMQQIL